MSIVDKINSDLVAAMKGKEHDRVTELRSLKSAIKYRQIDKGSELTDDDVIQVLSSVAKQHRDSIEQYGKGGRDDLVENEKAELEIIVQYLPEQLGPDEVGKLVDEVIDELGVSSPSDFGAVMKTVMPKVKGLADGKLVKEIVTKRLS
jgi:uncharacterized protein YqeY